MRLSILFAFVGALVLVGACSDHGDGHHPADGHDHTAMDGAHKAAHEAAMAATPKLENKAPAPEVAKASAAAEAPAAEPAAAEKAPMAFDEKPPVGTKATCPVMKGEFVVSENSDRSEFEGKHYAFCCPGCKPQFDADPKKFIDG